MPPTRRPEREPTRPPVLMRATAAPTATMSASAPASARPTIARAASAGGGTDDSYEAFLDRLRRDLLRERELYGDLLGERPW